MHRYEKTLNSIYCLSQEACSTISSLRLLSGAAKDINSYRLYVLLENLHTEVLEAFRTISQGLPEENLNKSFKDLSSIGLIIQKTFEIFRVTVDLPCDSIMLRKLEHEIDGLSLVLFKLSNMEVKNKMLNGNVLGIR